MVAPLLALTVVSAAVRGTTTTTTVPLLTGTTTTRITGTTTMVSVLCVPAQLFCGGREIPVIPNKVFRTSLFLR